MRLIWVLAGLMSVGFGGIGIVLPLLPTVPFLLLATFCFARSSNSLHAWLVSHPVLGPPIIDWNTSGAIKRGAKILATASIALTFVLSIVLDVKSTVLLIQLVVLLSVLIYIWTRPETY